MLFDIKNRHRPTRIKSLKELEPGFQPRWFKISFRAVLSGFPMMMLLLLGSGIEAGWLVFLSLAGFCCIAATIFIVNFVPAWLAFIGYWWPWLGLKSAQMDRWLERDLDWGGMK